MTNNDQKPVAICKLALSTILWLQRVLVFSLQLRQAILWIVYNQSQSRSRRGESWVYPDRRLIITTDIMPLFMIELRNVIRNYSWM